MASARLFAVAGSFKPQMHIMCNDAPVSRMDALSRIKSFLDNLCGDAESVA